MIEATKYQIKVIQKKDFDFSEVENILIDNDLQEFRETSIDLREIWVKLAKNDVLTSMLTDKTRR